MQKRYTKRMAEIDASVRRSLRPGEQVLMCVHDLSVPFGWFGTVLKAEGTEPLVRFENAWNIWTPRFCLVSVSDCVRQRCWRRPAFQWSELWSAYQEHVKSGFTLPPFFEKLYTFAGENKLDIAAFRFVADPAYSQYPRDVPRLLALVNASPQEETWIVGTPDGEWRLNTLERGAFS